MSQLAVENGLVLYKRLLSYVKPFWWALLCAILGTLVYAGVDSTFIYLMKPILNKGFNARSLHFIHWVPLIILVLFLMRGAANFVGSYFMAYVSRNVIMTIRQQLFQHFLRLPAKYYDDSSAGKMLSALMFNVEQLAYASTNALTSMLQAGALIIGLLIVMLINSWQLCLLYFLVLPIIAFAVKKSSKRMRSVSTDTQDAMADVTSIAEEAIEGYKVVRTFGGEQYEIDKFNRATNTNRNKEMKIVVTKTLTVSCVQFFAAIAIAATVYLAMSPTAVTLSAGAFASMIGAMLAILKPMKNITSVNSQIQKGLAGAQSVFALLGESGEVDKGAKTLVRAKGNIDFQHVNFSYEKSKQPVLKDIHFKVAAGQTIALVGRSGAGKSTLVSLLTRFYEIDTGQITLDGMPLQDIRLTSLRAQIALVSQHVILFNETVANNIAYGRFDTVPMDEIRAAAKAANALDFIEALPNGFNSRIGDNGVLLSGGQRQRLAIARAILKNAPILILDEATSALDTEAERFIQAALENLMRYRTSFVIAHRLSTIENADVILVLDNGAIVESGTHSALLAKQGAYAKLHAMQFKEQVA